MSNRMNEALRVLAGRRRVLREQADDLDHEQRGQRGQEPNDPDNQRQEHYGAEHAGHI